MTWFTLSISSIFLHNLTLLFSSLEVIATEDRIQWKRSACYLHSRSNFQQKFTLLLVHTILLTLITTDSVNLFSKFQKISLIFISEDPTYYPEFIARIESVFRCLPLAALIDNKVFCVYGGHSCKLTSLSQISNLERPYKNVDSG